VLARAAGCKTMRGSERSPVPSPDGRHIAYQGNEFTTDTYREVELYVMEADGSNPRVLANEMGGMGNVTWAEDGDGLYVNSAVKGTSNLWFISLDGEARQVTEGNHMLSVADIVGSTAVGTRTSYHEPGSLIAFDVGRPGNLDVLKCGGHRPGIGVQADTVANLGKFEMQL